MRNEQPVGATKRLHKRVRLIEVDRGGGDPAGQLGSVGAPGKRNDIDRIGSKKAGQRRADATCRARDGDARLARRGLNFFGHGVTSYLGTIGPTYLERSFQDVK